MLDVTRLRVLEAVARHGSVTAAARALRHNGHSDDRVYFGETAASGLNVAALQASMAPATFVRELTCLDPGFHPYSGAAARRRDCRRPCP